MSTPSPQGTAGGNSRRGRRRRHGGEASGSGGGSGGGGGAFEDEDVLRRTDDEPTRAGEDTQKSSIPDDEDGEMSLFSEKDKGVSHEEKEGDGPSMDTGNVQPEPTEPTEPTPRCHSVHEEEQEPKAEEKEEDILEEEPDTKDELCGSDVCCEECEERRAVVECGECGLRYCHGCSERIHKKGRRKEHRVVAIGTNTDAILSVRQRHFCSQHPDEKLSLYCQQCSRVVCAHCFLVGDHINHQCQSVHQAALEVKHVLRRRVDGFKEKTGAMETAVSSLRKLVDQNMRDGDTLRLHVRKNVDKLRQMISEREALLVSTVTQNEDENHARLNAQLEECQGKLDHMRATVSNADSLMNEADEVQFFADSAELFRSHEWSEDMNVHVFQQKSVLKFDGNLDVTTQLEALKELDFEKGAYVVIGTGPTLLDMQERLRDVGFSADAFDASKSTPTLSYLQEYDSVLVYSNQPFADQHQLGDVLADFVEGGGGVVVACFANCRINVRLGGRWSRFRFDPVLPGDQQAGSFLSLGRVYQPNHPVMKGVITFSGGAHSYHGSGLVNTEAVMIADWSNGAPLVAELDTYGGRIITLNFYPPATDTIILVANAVSYAGGYDMETETGDQDAMETRKREKEAARAASRAKQEPLHKSRIHEDAHVPSTPPGDTELPRSPGTRGVRRLKERGSLERLPPIEYPGGYSRDDWLEEGEGGFVNSFYESYGEL
eukprot:TRINITY_DN11430_c0_g1_i1.p1 TRINITY_DN11430_c0_g1~~TRINITY_DN11430_c0_g1_i1.p1  ORF type:complete len:728 (+),score=145.69 TRINITY_DN11430_c0_g1_i1:35-2185(+)